MECREMKKDNVGGTSSRYWGGVIGFAGCTGAGLSKNGREYPVEEFSVFDYASCLKLFTISVVRSTEY